MMPTDETVGPKALVVDDIQDDLDLMVGSIAGHSQSQLPELMYE